MGDYKKTSENVQATAVRFDSWQGIAWPVYEKYVQEYGSEGADDVFLVARRSPPRKKLDREMRPEDQVGGVADVFQDRRLKVYSPPLDAPDLFIRLAALGRQERITFEDMREWVEKYGALGLPDVDVVKVVLPLSKVEPVTPLNKKHKKHKVDHENGTDTVVRTDYGQGRRESFRGFCEAAWTIAETLSLFEALTDPQLQGLADPEKRSERLRKILWEHGCFHEIHKPDESDPVKRLFVDTEESAWSLVEQRVLSYVRRYCYPMSYRHTHAETGEVSHTPGWGFDSLLGAMYLQFKHAMESRSEIRRCAAPDCGRIISVGGVANSAAYEGLERAKPRKGRKDRKYCKDTNDRCKQKAYDRKKPAQEASGADSN